jgi:hypothetical protein
VLPWILESAKEEVLEGLPLLPKGTPGHLMAEAALLLVKYCLRGGGAAAASDTWTTWREPEETSGDLGCKASFARLCTEQPGPLSTTTAASAAIGSIDGSPWGSSVGDCFSPTSLLAAGLEHLELLIL